MRKLAAKPGNALRRYGLDRAPGSARGRRGRRAWLRWAPWCRGRDHLPVDDRLRLLECALDRMEAGWR